jgi:hypothetical protein
MCEGCIDKLPPTLRKSVRPPEGDEDMPNPQQTLAAAARAAETARVARVPNSTRCIIVRYQRTLHETEYTRRRCDMPVSTKHETGACFRCSSYMRRHEIDFDGLDLVHVDDEGLVIETPLLGVWAPYAERRPVDAGDPGDLVEETADEPSDADVVADYDQEIIDGLRVRIAELEREVAERDALLLERDARFLDRDADVERLADAEVEICFLRDQLAAVSAPPVGDDRSKLTRLARAIRSSLESAISAGAWSSVASAAYLLEIIDS